MASLHSVRDGEMTEFKSRLARAGLTAELLRRVNVDESNELARKMVHTVIEEGGFHAIDCNENPHIPDGWRIRPADQIKSRVTGLYALDPARINLYLSPEQRRNSFVRGFDLQRILVGKKVLPANVLDYLLEHPQLISKWWKKQRVFFWGTVYRNDSDEPCVRFLCWDENRWRSRYMTLGSDWPDRHSAVVVS